MRPAHVSLVTLGVADLARAEAFYTALGWRRSDASVDGVVSFMRGGPMVLSLWGRDELAGDAGLAAGGLAAGPGPTALACNLPDEASVDAAIAAAAEAGGRVTRPAVRADWGGYSGYVADPDGHLWEFAHNPGFPLRPDGSIRLPDEG
ncbi:MAG TPA: VOC family protein [Egicoccus sp.]|nr:VOC family protein [Egicoccus sp.]HSK24695.1 VOC family protein [Egicoccus sp.]